MTRKRLTTEEKIERQQKKVLKAKERFDRENEKLHKLYQERDEERKKELLTAISKSRRSYQEILDFINGKGKEEDDE